MADQEGMPQVLSMGRHPNGRFQITTLVRAPIANGQVVTGA